MVHGVNDWAHGKPFELSAEQGVINDVEQHSCNGAIQDLFQGQMGQLCIETSRQHKGHDRLAAILHRWTCSSRLGTAVAMLYSVLQR